MAALGHTVIQDGPSGWPDTPGIFHLSPTFSLWRASSWVQGPRAINFFSLSPWPSPWNSGKYEQTQEFSKQGSEHGGVFLLGRGVKLTS